MLDIRGKAPWVMFHGFYWGYEYSNLAKYGQPDRLPGTFGKMEVLNFAISLKNTNLAIGGSLVEGHLVKGTEPEGVTFKESIKDSCILGACIHVLSNTDKNEASPSEEKVAIHTHLRTSEEVDGVCQEINT
jgi:hypothetical protein